MIPVQRRNFRIEADCPRIGRAYPSFQGNTIRRIAAAGAGGQAGWPARPGGPGTGYGIEAIDADGNLFFLEVKGRVDGADSVTLTINEVHTGRNALHRFRLAPVSMEGDQVSAPVYVSGVDWGLPGLGDTQFTKNLQQLLVAGRAAH